VGFGLRRSAVGTRTFGVCATEKLGGVPLIHTQAAFTQTGTYGTPRLSKGTGRRGPLRVAGRAAAASPTTGRMAQRPAFGGPGGGLSQHGARSSRWARLRHSLVLFGFLGRKGPRSAAKWSTPWKRSFCASGQDRDGTVSCRCRVRLAPFRRPYRNVAPGLPVFQPSVRMARGHIGSPTAEC
jgi:hypothetical protein